MFNTVGDGSLEKFIEIETKGRNEINSSPEKQERIKEMLSLRGIADEKTMFVSRVRAAFIASDALNVALNALSEYAMLMALDSTGNGKYSHPSASEYFAYEGLEGIKDLMGKLTPSKCLPSPPDCEEFKGKSLKKVAYEIIQRWGRNVESVGGTISIPYPWRDELASEGEHIPVGRAGGEHEGDTPCSKGK